jgi:phosphoribosylformylglycinamidine cyclo-ligase
VSITEGERLVRLIKNDVRATFSASVLGDLGGFGGLFDARFRTLRSPVLVASTDGVGTKLLVAQRAGQHHTVGQDLVNHCVNDIMACGARPLFFLDYYATGKLLGRVAAAVIRGMAQACRENGCALIGGETAEMPGMYRPGEYDLCGTIVGVVDRREILDGGRIRAGDAILGLPSTGLHTNGYSLARSVLLGRIPLTKHVEELGCTLQDALLTVHRSYYTAVEALRSRIRLHGLSHITGGGIVGNTRRILPPGLRLRINWRAWRRPAIFSLIQRRGNVPEADMRRTFNLGIGYCIILAQRSLPAALDLLFDLGERPVVIGEVVPQAHRRPGHSLPARSSR